MQVAVSRQRAWASATFAGARHEWLLTGPANGVGAAGVAAWARSLAAADVPLRGSLIADLRVTERREDADGVFVRIDALTVEA